MKTKPKEAPKTTEAVVTSAARLTIQGQTFEMPLTELEDLYGKIGEALGKKTPDNTVDELRKLREVLKKRGDQPHYISPIPPILFPHTPHRPEWMPPDIICKDTSTFSMNACDIQMGKHSDQRDRF